MKTFFLFLLLILIMLTACGQSKELEEFRNACVKSGGIFVNNNCIIKPKIDPVIFEQGCLEDDGIYLDKTCTVGLENETILTYTVVCRVSNGVFIDIENTNISKKVSR